MLDLYCDKCGWLWHEFNNTCGNCEICGNKLKPVPNEYYENFRGISFISDEMKQKLLEELVFTSPNFDQYYFDNAINIKGQKHSEIQAKIEHGRAVLEGKDKGNSFGVTCPYCHATNVRKISIASRAVSAGLFGLGSKKIGKQWHCNHCGSDF